MEENTDINKEEIQDFSNIKPEVNPQEIKEEINTTSNSSDEELPFKKYKPLPVLEGTGDIYSHPKTHYLWVKVMISMIFIMLIIIGGFMIYLIADGRFQSLQSQNVSLTPLFNASVNLDAKTTNYNNITLVPSINIHIDKIIINQSQ